jgi:HSP20 family protein
VIKAEMPGIKKDEVTLNVFDNSLEVSGQHKEEEYEKKKNYVRKERSEISYYRVIPLPDKIMSDKAQAKLTDGILTVTVPKISPTKSKSNSIQVQ